MNFLQSKYKRNYILLLASLPFIGLLAWKLAFSQTYFNYTELSKVERDLLQYQQADQLLTDLKTQSIKAGNSEKIKADQFDETILDIISQNILKYHISFEEFPEAILENSSYYSTQIYTMKFSGSFISLLKFLDFLESELRYGNIISVNFERKNQKRSGEKLYMSIYYQIVFKDK